MRLHLDAGVHVREFAEHGRDHVGRARLLQAGQGVLHLLAGAAQEFQPELEGAITEEAPWNHRAAALTNKRTPVYVYRKDRGTHAVF